MTNRVKKFFQREDGAVTVDWVVLTAAVVALGVSAGVAMTNSSIALSDNIWSYMDSLNLFD